VVQRSLEIASEKRVFGHEPSLRRAGYSVKSPGGLPIRPLPERRS
jgi:hypothetical protein